MPDTTNNEGYLVQLRSPEGDNVYPIISAEMIKDKDGNVYNLPELFQSVSEGKALIAAAVTDRGVPTAATDSFQTMANNIAQISAYVGYGYNVTIVDNNNNPVPNQTVQCTTNGSSYTTNSSGQITTQIDSTSASLTFTWSTTVDNSYSTRIDGSLYLQNTNISTNSYTATISGTAGQVINDDTITTVDTNTNSSKNYYVNVAASVGQYVTIGTSQYIITHVNSANVYVTLRYWEQNIRFGSSGTTTYAGSTIANRCTTWYNDNVPSQWKNEANAFNTEYVGGVMAQCFIPTADQANGGWSYFNSNSRRIFTDSSGNAHTWWTSTPNTSSSPGDVLYVTNYGDINYFNFPTAAEGFRPAFAIKRSLFTS